MAIKRTVTLTDVARRAGVSRTTASYILNDRAAEMRIAVGTVNRVLRASDEMGYRPNRNAQNLRSSVTNTFGIISDHVASGHYASSMLTGASSAARRRDHLVMIGESEGDAELERELIEEMLDRQVDGIVYVRRATSRITLPDILRGERVVLLNCTDEDQNVPCVLPDEQAGGRTAADVLLASGVTNEIHVVGQDSVAEVLAGPLRLRGVEERLAEAGRSVSGIVATAWTVNDARTAVGRWLGQGARPGGLVCLNDRIAMGTYQALAAHGLDVPTDVCVVSFDGSQLATWLDPPLTSIAVPYDLLGQRAIEILADGASSSSVELVDMPVMDGRSVRPTPSASS